MCDIFTSKDCRETFRNMFILMVGDSNMKSYYKDLIYLVTHNKIGDANYFGNPPKSHREKRFCNDTLHSLNTISTGRDYFEDREFKDNDSGLKIRFCFATHVYGRSMKKVLNDIENKTLPMPNVILLNSCLWDLTRWGPKKEEQYMKNLITLFGELRRIIPASVQVIWTTTPPLSCSLVKGGVFIQQLEFTKHTMRFMVIEANSFVRKLCVLFERDLLDIHYHLRYQLHRRSIDGIHWEPHAVRHVTCLILTHIAISFKKHLPGNFDNPIVTETINLRDKKYNELDQALPDGLKEQVNKYLKKSEPAAVVCLKAIKMRDPADIPETNDSTRKTKIIRRRLGRTKNGETNNQQHPPNNAAPKSKPFQNRLSSKHASRFNFDNFPQERHHPTSSAAYQGDNHENVHNRLHFPHHDGFIDEYGRENYNTIQYQPNNLRNFEHQRFGDNAYYAGSHCLDNFQQLQQPGGLNLVYRPELWSTFPYNFPANETCFDHYTRYRKF